MPAKKIFFVSTGVLMVALGAAGIVLPLVPTTPFLLLAAYLFARSSDRLHRWLLNHRHLGPYIHAFRSRSGLTSTQKLRIGISMTLAMAASFYFAPVLPVKWFIAAAWAFWTVVLLRMRTNPAPSRVDA